MSNKSPQSSERSLGDKSIPNSRKVGFIEAYNLRPRPARNIRRGLAIIGIAGVGAGLVGASVASEPSGTTPESAVTSKYEAEYQAATTRSAEDMNSAKHSMDGMAALNSDNAELPADPNTDGMNFQPFGAKTTTTAYQGVTVRQPFIVKDQYGTYFVYQKPGVSVDYSQTFTSASVAMDFNIVQADSDITKDQKNIYRALWDPNMNAFGFNGYPSATITGDAPIPQTTD